MFTLERLIQQVQKRRAIKSYQFGLCAAAHSTNFVNNNTRWYFTQKLVEENDTKKTTAITRVGIFLDLDNISRGEPHLYTRKYVASLIRPLKAFANSFRCHQDTTASTATTTKSKSSNSVITTIHGFANEDTRTYQGPRELRDSVQFEQDWWEFGIEGDDDDMFPGASVQTGYDESGILRCGVCGQKMKLTKKDRKRGWTELDKLNTHMRRLHDREQAKRKNRIKQLSNKSQKKVKSFLKGKEGEKMRKYQAAQIGLNRQKVLHNGRKPNELIPILKEEGVNCWIVDNVDKHLIKRAKTWLAKQRRNIRVNNDVINDKKSLIILVVVSEDSDFAALLKDSSGTGVLTVSCTPNTATQSRKLVAASDAVLVRRKSTDDDEEEDDDVLVPKSLILQPRTDGGDHFFDGLVGKVFTVDEDLFPVVVDVEEMSRI